MVPPFLNNQPNNSKLRKELADFQVSNESTEQIESFICRGYQYRSNKYAQKRVHETATLNTTRYSLFTKKQFEGEKLPPTKSAFEYHLACAFFQVSIWSTATEALVNQFLDPLQYGWELDDGHLVGKMTSLNIAPLEVVELVACKCSKGNLNSKLPLLDFLYDLSLSRIVSIFFFFGQKQQFQSFLQGMNSLLIRRSILLF